MNKANYKNSITNLANSILANFNVKPFHNTIKEVDDILLGRKKVLLFLFDGMGKAILEKHLDEHSFLRSHILKTISSTIPPTTVAATNALLSAKYPIENGWLGWTQYFEEIDKNVVVFKNKDDETDNKIPGERLIDKYCGYKNIAELINEANNNEIAKIIFDYNVDQKDKKAKRLKSFIKHAFEETNSKEQSFTYAYWTKPDMFMHKFGTKHFVVHSDIKLIQKYLKKYSRKYKDVLTIIISDHGMKDVVFDDISKHQELVDMLVRPISLEKRTVNFFIKEDKKEQFKDTFNAYYGKHFKLMSKDEVINEHIFGEGSPNEQSLKFIGDYVAFALDELSLEQGNKKKDKEVFKGHHAGTTLDELEISLIVLNI